MSTMPAMNPSQLRWRCRRGMLELDILLQAFVDKEYAELTPEQSQVFYALLDYPDQVLFDLLLDKAKATDESVADIINRIRLAVL